MAATALLAAILACSPALPSTETAVPAGSGKATAAPPAEEPTARPTARPTQRPAPTPRPTARPQQESLVDLTLVNNFSEAICYVYLSPHSSDSWGQDWLGSDEVVQPGATRVFSTTPGEYDLRMERCDGSVLDEIYGLDLFQNTTWTFYGPEGDGGADVPFTTITVQNYTDTDVCWVYVTFADDPGWGDDWLGSDIIPAGAEYNLYVPPGSFDMRAEDCSGSPLDERFDVPISGATYTWTILGGGSVEAYTTLTLVNNTDIPVYYVYISPSSSSDWGGDWLGSDIIPAWSEYTFFLDVGTYDFMAQDSSGAVIAEQYGVYIGPEGITWTLYLE
ncbi:MAG: hypothetical protein Kow00124_11730 [Anaerolineae bacterium]